MSLLAQHADVLTKLAKVLDIGARYKEHYLNDVVAHSNKALDHVCGITLPSSHPVFKDILGNVMSGTSMLSEFKVQEDGLRSFNLKPNLDEIKEEEEVWREDEVWGEEVCKEDDDEELRRVGESLSLSKSSSHPPPPTAIEFDISKTNEEVWRKVEESLSLSESPSDPPPQIEIGN